ncbi:MAG: glutamate 5-kinase [Candidatus Saganbacteria bacterium]|nr:glutamate 5-kinase [Candidatus Saganbacteria bacterium]
MVIKIGASSLTDRSGKLDTENLRRLSNEIADIIKDGKKVVLVTSGAIVCGREKLKLTGAKETIQEKQAAAAVGQSLLMAEYGRVFGEKGLKVGQVLLTRDAIADRSRYINSRNTITALLELGAIPIVNENDTVSVDEIKVGDNDNLSALVASLVGADLIINLTNVDGFYMKDEAGEPVLVPEVSEITREIEDAAGHPSTQLGVGGMITKIQAAKIATDAGIPMVIASAKKSGTLKKIISGEKIGTIFHSKISKLESKKRWLAHGLPRKGSIVIDGGAESALKKHGGSLLAVGILEVKGDFEHGDAISIEDESGKEIGRGLSNYSSEDLKKIKGLNTAKIQEILGYKGTPEALHRDDLVLIE